MQQFKINIEFAGNLDSELIALIEDAAKAALAGVNPTNSDTVNLLISDDKYLRKLNYQYRGFDRPTDVLAFPMDAGVDDLDGFLGDIAVSLESAERQSNEAGHSVKSELQLLVVHGVLHLLGYDHETDEDKKVMWTLQADVLDQLNPEINIPALGYK